jgi:hypothetical protein
MLFQRGNNLFFLIRRNRRAAAHLLWARVGVSLRPASLEQDFTLNQFYGASACFPTLPVPSAVCAEPPSAQIDWPVITSEIT